MLDYAKIAKEVRLQVLEMLYKAQTSHIGSNFSCIDILTVLYENKKEEDEIIVSKGWVAATVYALLARKGEITQEALSSYCQPDSKYIGLLEPFVSLSIKCAGGSMGYGLPFGVGFALAKKIKGEKGKVCVLMSDGEMAIGTTWESALIAAHHKLDNLVVIVDNNGFQAMGKVKDILSIDVASGKSLAEKWVSFGWNMFAVEGHNFDMLGAIPLYIQVANRDNQKPICIIAHTTKGKGVSFMENDNRWHYLNIDKESYDRAKAELQS